MARILLRINAHLFAKICCNCRDMEFFGRDFFIGAPCIQGGPKKWGHCVWRLRSLHAHIFKMPEQISVIFGLLQCRYILNTSVDSILMKFIIHVRAFWRCGHAKIWAFKRSGVTFLDHPVCTLHGRMFRVVTTHYQYSRHHFTRLRRRRRQFQEVFPVIDYTYFAPVGWRCTVMSMSVCVSVCLSVRSHNSKTERSNFTKLCLHVARGRGSVLLWRRCDTLCTSGNAITEVVPLKTLTPKIWG